MRWDVFLKMKPYLSVFAYLIPPVYQVMTMPSPKVFVYVELDGNLHHVGELWSRSIRGR